MSNNLLDSLPSSVEFLNLKRLVLSNNKFESFPEEVTKMLHLQELFLGWNRIKVLPCSVGKLEKLIVLKVNDNLICDIPDEIDKLVCLEFLNIERNKLERLPSTLFTKLDKLKSFECRDNPLADPPGYVCESGLQNIRNYLERHQVVAVGNSRLEMPRRNVHIEMPDTNTLADMDDYDCYPMTTKPRGIALIFNNKTFYRNPAIPSSVKLPDRAGTDTDAVCKIE
uniref:Leucine-rich repeat and calponin homology domain-containing protein 2-like n=1 Tax=Saccoglossus kowalevskii TaxID=10224 RepID=A0ABM0M9A1_SACKO|nr:PREDICTED: leucine-rich repeat and calponin homology domain-containing protein 2-like [Saccoglossus kowalevskii]